MRAKSKKPAVLQRTRKKKREVAVEWDNPSEGAWHFVPRSKLSVLTPGTSLEAGARVSLKWKNESWLGTVIGKKKTAGHAVVKGEQ